MKASRKHPKGKIVLKLIIYMLSPLFGVLISGEICAYTLNYADLSNSYKNCYFQNNGDGTSTVSVTIDYKESAGNTGSSWAFFLSRGILIYSYDKYGRLKPSSMVADRFYMDDTISEIPFVSSNYTMYKNSMRPPWTISNPVVGRFKAKIYNEKISAEWPAVAIRAANYTNSDDVGEVKGVAYIVRDGSSNGSCSVITNPETPPPLDINISVSAPDWNLGDLPRGESDTTVSRADQQLCFSYNAADVLNEKFIISATNANGVVNNRYQLRHLSDTSQVVPYSLTLDSGGTRIQLPNNSAALSLNGGNRTCFVPTFKTEVGKTVKDGDYNDVLTFTITTKS